MKIKTNEVPEFCFVWNFFVQKFRFHFVQRKEFPEFKPKKQKSKESVTAKANSFKESNVYL